MKFIIVFAAVVLVACGSGDIDEVISTSDSSNQNTVSHSGSSSSNMNHDSCDDNNRKVVIVDGSTYMVPELCNPYWRDNGDDPVKHRNDIVNPVIRTPEISVQNRL